MVALEIEERFCWDHGCYLGTSCPRCCLGMEDLTELVQWNENNGN